MTLETPYSQHLSSPTLPGAIQDLADVLKLEADLIATARPVDVPRAPGKWSRKEILGHLIDSAVNNHQRFVRAQIPAHLEHGVLMIDGYAQADWVRVQDHQSRDWAELVALWVAFNRHVLHVMQRVEPSSLNTPCIIGTGRPLPLEAVMVDYVGHVKHHLDQILG
jgi:DinB superfamily